jgi:hypothetical protein
MAGLQMRPPRQPVRISTAGTQTPEHDFGLIDDEAGIVLGQEAWTFLDRAVDVLCMSASPADEVVVVIVGPGLEQGRRPGRLDTAHQPCGSTCRQYVVHGLRRNRTDLLTDKSD